MQCPGCGAEVSTSAKFCSACGVPQRPGCAACGQPYAEGSRFCSDCGAPVATDERAPGGSSHRNPPGPQPDPPHYLADKILASRGVLEGERKQITVLFADIKGSTELIQGLEIEQAQHLLDATVQTMMAAVHRYEGTVNHILGDGIMALFGAPLAHEDHALRACYAALDMQDSVSR